MAMTKRDFLIGAAAASGGVMFSRIDASAQAERRVIDAHTHWYPAQWVELVQNEGEAAGARIGRNDRGGITFNAGGIGAVFNPNYIDLESRIKSMDETGINAQVLSLMGPMVYWAPPAFGLKLAQIYNDACSAAHRKYPDRFVKSRRCVPSPTTVYGLPASFCRKNTPKTAPYTPVVRTRGP
jgi:hypothetical protein